MTRRTRSFSLTAFALVTAILGTAALLLLTTLRSLDRDRELMSRELERQGMIIIRTIESGARAGMMMRWGRDQLQALVEQAALLPEIAFVGIFDSSGDAVARHSREIAEPPWPDAGEVGKVLGRRAPHFSNLRVEGKGIFQVARRFAPSSRPGAARRRGHMMMRNPPPEASRDLAIVLGLYTGPWEKILAEGRRQSLLSFLVILIAGSIALYLAILLQNHFIVRRTLSETKAYAQNILENMADGLLSVDGEGKIATFNPEAGRILMRPGEELRGKDVSALLPALRTALETALAGSTERQELELSLGEEGGEGRPTGVAISPLRGEEGKAAGAVLILRDLTEVRRLQRKIGEAEKLAAVGQMAATVAHEIRNPLSSLRGFAQLFEGKFAKGSTEAGYAGLMVREVDRLNRTVADLLFYAKPVTLTRSRTDLDGILKETLRLLEPEIAAEEQEATVMGEKGIVLEADPDQLARVFINIVLNAHQASGRGGRIAIHAGRKEGRCRVTVRDSGPGMAPETIARAFDPFFTTREKGSGLGLAIVKKIVDLHEGKVAVESDHGAGTAVTVELPLPVGEEGGHG